MKTIHPISGRVENSSVFSDTLMKMVVLGTGTILNKFGIVFG